MSSERSGIELTVDQLVDLLCSAIENKYDRKARSDIQLEVVLALQEAKLSYTEEELRRLNQPPATFAADIRNQVVAYLTIERVWSKGPPIRHGLQRLYSVVYGIPVSEMRLRTLAFVADFGGSVPTPVEEIPDHVTELNVLLSSAVDLLKNGTIWKQANFLAEFFSRIIRVHPFEDGNGRTARIAVQYCLRRWRRSFISIPKVRNVPEWKSALEQAIAGNCGLLASKFALIIEESEASMLRGATRKDRAQ